MNGWYIFLIFILLITFFIIWILITIKGCKLCNENNAIGIFLLFLSMNIAGLILGFSLIYNFKENEKKEKKEIKNA